MIRDLRMAALAASAISLAACGGGGGSGAPAAQISGNAPAPAGGPGDVSNLFPLGNSDNWNFDETYTPVSGSSSSGDSTLSVTGATTFHGQRVVGMLATDPVANLPALTSYFSVSGGGVTYYGDNSASDVFAPLAPYAQLLFPARAGTVSTVQGTNLPAGTAGNGDPLTLNVTQTVTNAGTEAIAVDAGYFPAATKTILAQTGTVTDTNSGQSLPMANSETTWLAPNVGIVRDVQSASVGPVSSSEDRQLRSYTVGGLTHGLLQPFAVANGGTTGYGRTWIAASDSSVMTVAASAAFALAVNVNRLDGTSLYSGSLVSPQNTYGSAFFDGTNFEIVTAQVVSGTPSVVVQRISPAGAVLDPAPGYTATPLPAACQQSQLATGRMGTTGLLLVYACGGSPLGWYGVILNPAGGAPLTGFFQVLPDNSLVITAVGADVAFDGTNYLLAVLTSVGAANHIVAQGISAGGALVGGPISVADDVVNQVGPNLAGPSVSFDGTNYLVVWLDARDPADAGNSMAQIYGNRISTAGNLLDGPSTGGGLLLSGNDARARRTPWVRYNGAEYLVFWSDDGTNVSQDRRGVVGVRLAQSGAITSGPGFEIHASPPPVTIGNVVQGFPMLGVEVVPNTQETVIGWFGTDASGAQTTNVDLVHAF